jgi:hypothetical protein
MSGEVLSGTEIVVIKFLAPNFITLNNWDGKMGKVYQLQPYNR